MPYDIIYDQTTNDVLQVFHNPNVLHKQGTQDTSQPFHHLRSKGFNPALVPWIPHVPPEVLRNPNLFKVKFEGNYSKPQFVMNKNDLTKTSFKFPMKIKDKKILWCGTFYDYISYSNITRDLAFRLFKEGENVKFFSTKSSGEVEIDKETAKFIQDHTVKQKDLEKPERLQIVSYIPLNRIPHAVYSVSYTMLETFNTQQKVIDAMNTYLNEIWVPTEYSRKLWEGKLNDKIKLNTMPLWFDKKRFYPGVVPCDCSFECINDNGVSYPKHPSGYKFIGIGRYTHRKGFDILIKSYIEEFSKNDDVSLVLFSRHIISNPEFNKYTKEKFQEMIKKAGKGKDSPPVYVNMVPVKPEEQGGIYGWGNSLVLPSRGEGFGIPPIEAAACKIPVISANHTGLSDFMDDSVGWVIPTDKVDNIGKLIITPEGKKKYIGKYPEWIPWITTLYNDMLFAVMGQESVETCKRHMRNLFEGNYKDEQEKIDKFYDRVHEKYEWENCYKKIRTRIDEILNEYS